MERVYMNHIWYDRDNMVRIYIFVIFVIRNILTLNNTITTTNK